MVFIIPDGYSSTFDWILKVDGCLDMPSTICCAYPTKSGRAVFRTADTSAITAWLDNYCSQHPLKTPAHGAVDLIEELKRY